ncbi:hypothetical protein JXR93_10380 [bacterium]|nr:hypothetical protein [bacterium]
MGYAVLKNREWYFQGCLVVEKNSSFFWFDWKEEIDKNRKILVQCSGEITFNNGIPTLSSCQVKQTERYFKSLSEVKAYINDLPEWIESQELFSGDIFSC